MNFHLHRIKRIAWPVAKILEHILLQIHPYLFLDLQAYDRSLGLKMNTVSDYVNRNIRIFADFRRKSTRYTSILNDILIDFQETCAFGKNSTIYDYERWFAQKFILCLSIQADWNENENSIMTRTSPLPISPPSILTIVIEDDDNWGDLYT